MALSYYGFMLDVSRHFMPPEDVCRLLDAAALCGVNTMHWHLTDDQGWRVEIRKYPLLTQVGSRRGATHFGRVSETENNCGYYTQEQIRSLVAYARERGIQIIPEIDIPGHASALLAAYPQFGCRRTVVGAGEEETVVEAPYDYQVLTTGGIYPNLICAGKDEALRFLEDILDELTELFPAPYVHIGGDEALKLHWRRCPDCRRRIRQLGLKDEEDLQRWLVLEVGKYLAGKGKRTIVYNDCLAGGLLPEYFVVQQWLGMEQETREFLESGGTVIRSETNHYYYDYAYSDIDVHTIWSAPRIPAYAQGLEAGLVGVECMLWTERVTNLAQAARMLFPRLPAAILKAREPELPWDAFCQRLRETQQQLEAMGITGAPEALWHLSEQEREQVHQQDRQMRTTPETILVERDECRLVQQEQLEKLLWDIEMPYSFALRVIDHAFKDIPNFCGTDSSLAGDGVEVLAEQLLEVVKSREDGPWKDIPRQIYVDTMKCFSRFVREHRRSLGYYGFDRWEWTPHQVKAELFRIGQLEYQLYREEGQCLIGLHIPSDVCLDMALLDESVAQARRFLEVYFPSWAQAPMECESWLLSPALAQLLPEGSRILRFQRPFQITQVNWEPNDVLEWVFKLAAAQQKNVDLARLPEDTSLQRSMKAALLAGKKIGVAHGRLVAPFQSAGG